MVRLHQVAEPLPYVWGAVFPLSVVTRRPYARRELCRVEPGLSVRMGFGACYHQTSESGIQKQLAKQVQGEPPGLDRIVRGLTRAPYQSIWKEVVPVGQKPDIPISIPVQGARVSAPGCKLQARARSTLGYKKLKCCATPPPCSRGRSHNPRPWSVRLAG